MIAKPPTVQVAANVVRPPGQGVSRAARRRRARRQNGGGVGKGTDRNDYIQSLQDPENFPGVRVPDLVTFPSSTFQLTFDTLLTPDVSGTVYGDGVGAILYPRISATAQNWFGLYTGTTNAVGGAYNWVGKAWTKEATIRSLFDSYRPVSAALYAEFAGNSVTDSGTICMGMIPRDEALPVNVIPTFTTALAQSYTKTVPLRNGGVITWKPQDNADLEYKDIQDTDYTRNDFPSIFVCTAGMSASATTNCSLRIRAIVNFEALPTTDTFAILNTQESPSNLGKLEQAMNWASQTYNNMSPFVANLSPFVQPMLDYGTKAATALGTQYLSNRLTAAAGNSLRIRY